MQPSKDSSSGSLGICLSAAEATQLEGRFVELAKMPSDTLNSCAGKVLNTSQLKFEHGCQSGLQSHPSGLYFQRVAHYFYKAFCLLRQIDSGLCIESGQKL